VIIVALKGMLMQVQDYFKYRQRCQIEAFVWLATFLSVVLLSIDIGLSVGAALNMVCIFCNSFKAHCCLLGSVPGTDLFLDVMKFERAVELANIKIFHYGGSINFATKSAFKNRLCNLLDINILQEIKIRKKTANGENIKEGSKLTFKHLIIDFGALTLIDSSSIDLLSGVIKEFNDLDISVSIAACSCKIFEILMKNHFKFMSILYPTINDAIHKINLL
jgi:solute carrier family 26 protein